MAGGDKFVTVKIWERTRWAAKQRAAKERLSFSEYLDRLVRADVGAKGTLAEEEQSAGEREGS